MIAKVHCDFLLQLYFRRYHQNFRVRDSVCVLYVWGVCVCVSVGGTDRFDSFFGLEDNALRISVKTFLPRETKLMAGQILFR